MAGTDPELVARLTGPEGRELLARATELMPMYAADAALGVTTRLRADGFDPELVAAALAQSRLRAMAHDKFGPATATFGASAADLYFTADGREQATRPELAVRHAERFTAAGVTAVFDLGCGIGSDAIALASAGIAVSAVDADPLTVAVARANLSPWPNAAVILGRAEDLTLPTGPEARHTGVWIDPARRESGARDVSGRARRLWSLDAISPSWAQVQAWAAQVPATGAKLSPAFPHASVPAGAEAQWTSWHGEVLECALWWGPLTQVAGRTAAVCRPGSPPAVVTEADLRDEPALAALDELGPWLHEADRAVVRAGLSGALPGRALTAGIGLATSAAASVLPWLRSYAVIDAMPLRPKAIRAWLRARDIGRVTLKKRGSAVDPDRLLRELSARGAGAATLVATSIAGQSVAVIVEPGGVAASMTT